MKKLLLVILSVTVLLGFTNCERIDAGHEGMKVNLYGTNRGVDDVSLVTGWVWYNPVTTRVYEYPTFVQTIDYPEFSINAKDGSEFMVDPTISIKMQQGRAPEIFVKYRRSVNEILNHTMYNYVKNAFRVELNKFTTDSLVSQREAFEKNLEAQLRITLDREGFELIEMTSGLSYPQSIVQAVNQKNKAIQEALQAENELRVATANANKAIAQAEGERKANELRMQSLTSLLIQQQMIQKWDGKLPVYGQVPELFRTISK